MRLCEFSFAAQRRVSQACGGSHILQVTHAHPIHSMAESVGRMHSPGAKFGMRRCAARACVAPSAWRLSAKQHLVPCTRIPAGEAIFTLQLKSCVMRPFAWTEWRCCCCWPLAVARPELVARPWHTSDVLLQPALCSCCDCSGCCCSLALPPVKQESASLASQWPRAAAAGLRLVAACC